MTQKVEGKAMYLERVGDRLVGCGIYQGGHRRGSPMRHCGHCPELELTMNLRELTIGTRLALGFGVILLSASVLLVGATR